MSQNLYMKTEKFKTNAEMANYFGVELTKRGFELDAPSNEGYMYCIRSKYRGETVTFYMGRNDEDTSPPLWQIWPEQEIPFLKRLFGTPDRGPEQRAKLAVEEIAKRIEGVEGVEWAI